MNKADKAESLFRTGYNCSQSVYAAFAEELGITVEEAAKKASPFGAGFGKLREVCGAVYLCRSFVDPLKLRKEA